MPSNPLTGTNRSFAVPANEAQNGAQYNAAKALVGRFVRDRTFAADLTAKVSAADPNLQNWLTTEGFGGLHPDVLTYLRNSANGRYLRADVDSVMGMTAPLPTYVPGTGSPALY